MITKAPLRIFLPDSYDLDILNEIALLSCAALFVSLLVLTCGVDLRPDFF